MRLNRYLARAGVASRRASDELIKAGRVTVNGRRGELNTFVASRDVVEVDGDRVGKQELAHVLLNKPLGVVTTASDPEGRPTVVDLVGHDARVVPVGRLDIDTSGVLLLTNDGDLAHRLAHPRYGVEKTYVADVEGDLTPAAVSTLANGVELEDGITAPARARQLGRSRVELVLHEGRNRQVRRMCEAVGHPVVRLRRTGYAGLDTHGVEVGGSRALSRDEVTALRRLVGLEAGRFVEMGFRTVDPDTLEWITRPHEPGRAGAPCRRAQRPRRVRPHAGEHLALRARRRRTAAPPRVTGGDVRRPRGHADDVPRRAAERRDVPAGGLIHVDPGTPLQTANHGDVDLVVYAYGYPPENENAELLDPVV